MVMTMESGVGVARLGFFNGDRNGDNLFCRVNIYKYIYVIIERVLQGEG